MNQPVAARTTNPTQARAAQPLPSAAQQAAATFRGVRTVAIALLVDRALAA
jgi:hypothetical protein